MKNRSKTQKLNVESSNKIAGIKCSLSVVTKNSADSASKISRDDYSKRPMQIIQSVQCRRVVPCIVCLFVCLCVYYFLSPPAQSPQAEDIEEK